MQYFIDFCVFNSPDPSFNKPNPAFSRELTKSEINVSATWNALIKSSLLDNVSISLKVGAKRDNAYACSLENLSSLPFITSLNESGLTLTVTAV